MTNAFLFMKQVHRFLVFIILVLGLIMAVTGVLLKYSAFITAHASFVSLAFIRYLHNNLSTYFGVVLFVMIITGVWMYVYPGWQARKHRQTPPPPDTPLQNE
jgi:hypothetical protein